MTVHKLFGDWSLTLVHQPAMTIGLEYVPMGKISCNTTSSADRKPITILTDTFHI